MPPDNAAKGDKMGYLLGLGLGTIILVGAIILGIVIAVITLL